MEQYCMPKELDFENLRKCLDNYDAEFLNVRLKGSYGGDLKIFEYLEGKTLDFKKNDSGLYLSIDSKEVFHFPLENYQKGFSLKYDRPFPDGSRSMFYPCEPYEPFFPEPSHSFLRNVLDKHLLEISFKGRIDLEFHSWMDDPNFKYWTVD